MGISPARNGSGSGSGAPRRAPPAIRPGGATVSVLVAGFFALEIAALGGSSRYDMIQLVVLMPLACLAAGYGLYSSWNADWRTWRVPLILLLAWTGLTLLQLVPLPPDMWRALAGRGPMAAIADLVGDRSWRPLSMEPWRTQHALWMMAVPLAALFLFVGLRERATGLVVPAIIAIAVFCALLGILQSTLGAGSGLYYYAITNTGSPVGLFANHNHSATLTTVVMILIAVTAAVARKPLAAWQFPVLGACFFILLLYQLINASRAGLGLGMIALLVCAAIILQGWDGGPEKRRPHDRAPLAGWRKWRIAAPLIGIAVMFAALLYYSDRIPSVDRLLAQTTIEEQRFQTMPVIWDMVWTYFPWGSGFGTFESVYKIHEPVGLLTPEYLNQAHNDVLQVLVEGGLPALIIVLAAIAWLGRIMFGLLRLDRRGRVLAIGGAGIAVCLTAASTVDYPLRTPLFQMIAVWLACVFVSKAGTVSGDVASPQADSNAFPPDDRGGRE